MIKILLFNLLLLSSMMTPLSAQTRPDRIWVRNNCSTRINILIAYYTSEGELRTTGFWEIPSNTMKYIPEAFTNRVGLYYYAYNATHTWESKEYYIRHNGNVYDARYAEDRQTPWELILNCNN